VRRLGGSAARRLVHRSAGVRLIGVGLTLFLAAQPPSRLAAQASPTGISVSANPVRSAPVHLHWPAGTGDVRVAIYSQLGTRIVNTVIPTDPGTFAWDLSTERGEPVANGAYAIVVTRADGQRFRRRLLVAR